MERLGNGRKILQEIHDTKKIDTYDVPGIEPERDVYDRPPPLEGDSWVIPLFPYARLLTICYFRFYIATDERSKESLRYIQSKGGILVGDLLTWEDRQEFGWPIMLTDVVAIVEQTALSHSAYFYGHALSSVGGGIVNMRAARGADRRTALVE
jgi:hypothetical protein